MADIYGIICVIIKNGITVRYVSIFAKTYTVRFFCNGTGTARYASKIELSTVRWYGMVQGARYVVRKF